MSVDQILYAPIKSRQIHNPLIDIVKEALNGTVNVEFYIDPTITMEVYDEIANLIENDTNQIASVQRAVTYDPTGALRPKNALTVKDVFYHLQHQNPTLYFTSHTPASVVEYRLSNRFVIEARNPLIELAAHGITANTCALWCLSLLSNFTGYCDYYAFASETEAQRYRNHP